MVDVVLAVASAATLLVTAVAIGVSWGGVYWLFDAAAGLVVCWLALWWRGQDRAAAAGLVVAVVAVLVAWAADLPQEPGPATVLGLAVLVGSAVRALPARRAVAVAAAGFAVVAGTWFAATPSSAGITAVTTLNALGWLGAIVVGLSGRLRDARRRAFVDEVRREERMELARELHDVAAHHLTGIVIQAQAAQLAVRKNADDVGRSLADIEAAGSEALGAIRRVVGLLRDGDDVVSAAAGCEQIGELVRRFQDHGHGPAVQLRMPADGQVWPAEVSSTVYRIVQESLTNIARHAPAAGSVTIDVAQDHEALTIEVTDDAPTTPTRYRRGGHGLSGHGLRGHGLIGMRERVEALGGTLQAGRRADAGWSIRADLPFAASGRE